MRRFTPDNIESLGEDEIFVFGSNPRGSHMGGAARTALKRFGAVMGQGEGPQGRSYAIPTTFPRVEDIKPHVDRFLDLAEEWDQNTFLVTRIGCGIAGFTPEQIAPFFDRALDMYNVVLPRDFYDILVARRAAAQSLPGQPVMPPMRKSSRRMDAAWALDVFDRAPYITLAMTRPDGLPYSLPLSLVRADEVTFYFHCAHEGEKIRCIETHPEVCLSAVSRCHPVFEKEKENFTMYYDSAIAMGRAEIVTDRNEKIIALRMICQRFLPGDMSHFDSAVERSLDRTAIVRIRLTEAPVGKCKDSNR